MRVDFLMPMKDARRNGLLAQTIAAQQQIGKATKGG